MSDTHTPTHRYIIRRAVEKDAHVFHPALQLPPLYHVIDTETDLSYGCFAHESALRIAGHLNSHKES